MLLSISKKINAKWEKIDAKIIQLDNSIFLDIIELKNVLIKLSKYDRVHQCINTIIVDIREAYGVFISRDWSRKIKVYFAI